MEAGRRRARLREILAGQRCVIASSVFDPVSARIADELGFEVGLMGGSVASFAVLGAPDLILLTLTELAEQARRVCRAGRLAVLVDADHGYGNALNVMRTVEELEAAGVAGLTIEDTLLPRPFGPSNAPQLVSIEEGVGKMQAAVAARRDSGLVVLGRTGAAAITSLDDAVARLKAYAQAGADALFVPGLKTRGELDRIAAEVKLPLVVAGADESLAGLDYLSARGARIWMAGHQPFAAAVQAIYETGKAVRAGTPPSKLAGIASGDLMAKVTCAPAYDAYVRKFMAGS